MTMQAVAPLRPRDYSKSQLALIKRTVAADCNEDEFNLFIEVARRIGLDPFRRQLYAIVYNKDNAEKRKLALITGIDGFRAVAARNRDYRPDDSEPQIVMNDELKNPMTNPLGIERAVVKCYKLAPNGEWHPVVGVAYWDEFAPITEEFDWIDTGATWPDSGKPKRERRSTGRYKLGGKWAQMGRVLICKCAEAQAIRKGWPEDLSGVYADEEMDRATLIDGTASEMIGEHEREERLRRVGGHRAIAILWEMDKTLEMVPLGTMADRCMAHVKTSDSALKLKWWADTNRVSLQQFWAESKSDALAVKAALEKKIIELEGKAA